LRGRGIPGQGANEAGDLYLEISVVLPDANTAAARKIYEDMARDMAFNPRDTSATSTQGTSE
jgi:curved DNA-binding protein